MPEVFHQEYILGDLELNVGPHFGSIWIPRLPNRDLQSASGASKEQWMTSRNSPKHQTTLQSDRGEISSKTPPWDGGGGYFLRLFV